MLKECRVSNYSPGTGGPREGGGKGGNVLGVVLASNTGLFYTV